MLGWAILFFILAVIALVLGYGGLAHAFVGLAQLLFFFFVTLFVLALVVRALRGRPPPV
jgi:uncharacterized membrane protein YtjA (UPF0391 family)